MSKNGSYKHSFKNALYGLLTAMKKERNFKIMMVVAGLVIVASFLLKISLLEFTVVIWAIFAVFAVEMINTAIESIVDLVKEEWHQKAKQAKDVAAGMVLLAVIGASVIGCLIFVPRIFLLISRQSGF